VWYLLAFVSLLYAFSNQKSVENSTKKHFFEKIDKFFQKFFQL